MPEQLHAILDDVGNVLQVIVWDGVTSWAPSKTLNIKPCAAAVSIGWKYSGTAFIAPKPVAHTKEQLNMVRAMSASVTDAKIDEA